jgi:hypothetical protein
MTDLMTIWELIKVALIVGATFTLVAGSAFIGGIICAIPLKRRTRERGTQAMSAPELKTGDKQ